MLKILMLIALVANIFCSCGKKIEQSTRSPEQGPGRGNQNDGPDLNDALRRFIERQEYQCEDDLHCHESIARIVVVDRQDIRYCTGVLIAPNKLLTSASCLPKILRVPALNCAQNIFAFFPKTTFTAAQMSRCHTIESSDSNDESDPALWSSDFTVIRLQNSIARPVVELSTEGLKNEIPYRTYKVDYENDYLGMQNLTHCFPIYNSYANPFANKRYSPMIPVRDCDFDLGNEGAALMDFEGKLVGIFSSKLDKGVNSYIESANLLVEPMAPMHHVANTACLNINTPTSQNQECKKIMNIALLDKERRELLFSKNIHEQNLNDITSELEQPTKYFKWKVSFYADATGKSYEPHMERPKCFFAIETWINEFSRRGRIWEWTTIEVEFPNYMVETKLDRKLRPLSFVANRGTKSYSVSFNPRYAFNLKNTNVNINSVFQGNNVTHRYQNVTNQCED
jgi:hypothetical protein